jgi:hypothetical protein
MRLAFAAGVVIALLAGPSAASADEWTTRNTALELTYAVAHVADWRQTLDIGAAGRETNPILGSHPSAPAVHAYFASALAAHALVAWVLPRGWREGWQAAWIVVETGYVAHNLSLGWRLQF